ncbi:hypothetical protein NIES970_10120 [[Synechococcus] sp. NIES-970]|uniref:DUF2808 domain-containing protein n=1 Tax=Picosynechococcus sp. NKBG15041c TaxID=1407650 RepID=UPI00040D196A|nr:DUF2808 domain-containing protein [Picosynechococcus sp. NKBG15041c]BAW96091.1 hypothetical protein NIES970_10120 [[Synechococcus] sp. NIES-970]
MQFLRSPLSRLAIATLLFGSGLTLMPQAADARKTCGSFTFNWGGTIPQGDILKCAVEYDSGARRRDRYYLEIRKSKVTDRFQTFELSFPDDFDGQINDTQVRVRINGREVALNQDATAWDPQSLPGENASAQGQALLESFATSTSQTSARDGELTFVDGQLVFVDAATLAEQQATQTNPNATSMAENNPPAADESEERDSGPRSRSLVVTLAEPVNLESEIEIILDDVRNPSRGGMYVVTAFARSQGAPLPSRLGSWIIDVGF